MACSRDVPAPVRNPRSPCPARGWWAVLAAVFLAWGSPLAAQLSMQDLRSFSLEELMGLEVTSVSRKPEPFVSTAGAVGVMTGQDVQQTGYRSIADALRYATGLQVARVDGRVWAISARGFNASESNKLLVLMDGRTVYTPLFSGVLWDVQDTFLPDLDRIEIIRGPGATMWGANAVNGVISITTKNARYTQGGLLTVGGGTEERAFASARYGGEVPGKFFYRVYAKGYVRDDMTKPDGLAGGDEVRMAQGGFRLDSAGPEELGGWTVQGDYYEGRIGPAVGAHSPVSGGNLLARLTRQLSGDVELTTQVYFDHVSRDLYGQYSEVLHTYDFDTQVRFSPWEHHEFVAGVNYRSASDHTGDSGTTQFAPARRRIEKAGAFVQDEIRLFDGKLGLILGSKLEYHESIGAELQPSARLAIRGATQTLWAAVSRAVRTPSRYDEDLRFPNTRRPLLVGNPDFQPEQVIAYELGYRAQPTRTIAWDVSVFFNDYSDLRSQERSTVPGRRVFGNKLRAQTDGVEVSAKWQLLPKWRLQAGYAYLHERFTMDPSSTDASNGIQEWNDPEHTATLRSSLQFFRGFEWDVGVRYVSSLPHPAQESYTAVDSRLVWRYRGQWEFALVGQNLLDPVHTEFGPAQPNAHQVERSFYGSVSWEF